MSDDTTAADGGAGRIEAVQVPPDDEIPLQIPDVKREVETILVPVDGSQGSERGLAYGDLLAGVTGAEIVVVVAYDPPIAIKRRTGNLQVAYEKAEMEEEAKELAAEAVLLLTERGRRARGIVVRGDAAEAILETAETEGADMIVIGRRGLGRLKGLLVGSVSERVARHAGVPVFLAS